MKSLFLGSATVFGLFLLSACGGEPTTQKELIFGRWSLENATRNGSPTESLDDLFFVFSEDGSMNTNLPIAPGDARYELEGNNLRQYDGPQEVNYNILELADSTLVMEAELRNFRFVFTMKKAPSLQ